MRKLLPAPVLLLLLGGFDFVPPHKELAAPSPVFKAEEFFLGRTEGKGTIKGPFGRHSTLLDEGVGRVERDGTLVLDQRVHREGHPVETRQWRIRKAAGNRYVGTLSDARGPIAAEVKGNCLHLKYTLAKGGFTTEQYVYLQPGGRVAQNRMMVKRFGLTVASVEEVIRKVG